MKYILILTILSFSLMAFQNQRYNFEKAWKEVETFQNEGLPQSAINKVNEIYGAANREKHMPYLVKAISYKSSLTQILAEEENTDHIRFLEVEYQKLSSPDKEIVGLLLYKSYQDYYMSYAYKYAERTSISNDVPDDINLWAPENFQQRLLSIANDILEDPQRLNVDIRKYSEIITELSPDGYALVPTLYDLLGYTLISWISNPINDAHNFDLTFNINDPLYLADFRLFIELDITCVDPNNYVYQVLEFYQGLISFHYNQGNEDALLYVDGARLDFVRQRSSLGEKNELFLRTLDEMLEYHQGESRIKKLLFKKALFLYNNAIKDSKTENYRNLALKICQEHGDSSYFGKKILQLSERILQPGLNGKSKEVYTSNEEPEFTIETKNIEKIWWKVIPLPGNYREKYPNEYESRFHQFVKSIRPIKDGSHIVQKDPNFHYLKSQFEIDKLNLGAYALVISPSENIEKQSKGMLFLPFQVSNIAYASLGNQKIDLIISDRRTGKPLEGAIVNLYNNYYDRDARTNKKKLLTSLKSDEDGKVVYGSDARQSISIDVSYERKDLLNASDSYYLIEYPKQELTRSEAIIFTDRSIYRPGQNLYFKGLVLTRDQYNIPTLDYGGREITITLKDANYQDVSSYTLVANEYSSISGEFVLPIAGLTGDFSLEIRDKSGLYGSKRIKVEEYRRPKFKVELTFPNVAMSVGDSISVSGIATSFAGFSIDNSPVSYRVYRSEVVRYRDWSWRIFPPSPKVLIDVGETKTDGDGVFEVNYQAIGDGDKMWIYTVEADVTDQSGETQSGNNTISLGKADVILKLDGEKLRSTTTDSPFSVLITNNAGSDLNRPIELSIVSLKDPKRIISIEDDPYKYQYRKNGQDPLSRLEKWESDKIVFQKSYSEEMEKSFEVGGLKPGGYKVVVVSGDQTLEDYFIINDFNKGKFAFASDLYVEKITGNYKPGDKVEIKIGTPHKRLYLYHEELHRSGTTTYGWIELCRKETIETTVREDDHGGFYISLTYFYDNRFQTAQVLISVPWSHKELDFEFTTIRDVLLPGQNETWKLKITGEGRERIAAEVLASMYDMSLDQFINHDWIGSFYPQCSIYGRIWNGKGYRILTGRHLIQGWNNLSGKYNTKPIIIPRFDMLLDGTIPGVLTMSSRPQYKRSIESTAMAESADVEKADAAVQQQETSYFSEENQSLSSQPLRSDLEETVFFYPDLMTDQDGNLEISFKMKEALTTWKLMLFAHDKDLRTGILTKEIVTKKELMVIPYPPRFLRQQDKIEFSGKVTNLSDHDLSISTRLELINARTMEDVTHLFIVDQNNTSIELLKGQSSTTSWGLEVPSDFSDLLLYRVMAFSEDHTDGEEGLLPVLTNKILLTDTRAFALKSGESGNFDIDALFSGIESKELINVTLDYTTHPIWTVIQAIPYLNDYPYDCTEQLVNKYYANALGYHILDQVPNIKGIMDQWSQRGSQAFLSNLQKNEELKSALLEETPWLTTGMDESEQRKALAILFDINAMTNRQQTFVRKLKMSQNPSGGFPWFPGGRDNTFISQYVLESFGRMQSLGIVKKEGNDIHQLIKSAIKYIDEESTYRLRKLKENINRYGGNIKDNHLTAIDVHYLYVRSMFGELPMDNAHKEAFDYYMDQASKYWLARSDYEKAMIGITMQGLNNESVTSSIVASFSERAIHDLELGMYWKRENGYRWNQLPIETHAMIIALYVIAGEEESLINDLKLWLINHKRTNRWPTTKGTAAAIHALLSGKSSMRWIAEDSYPNVAINGNELNIDPQAGTGYLKKVWKGQESNTIQNIEVQNNNSSVSWGGIYIQYFEEIADVSSSADNMISIVKKVLVEDNQATGKQLLPLEDTDLNIGDKLIVRLEISVDRDMEFVHLKDLRGSGVEPIDVLSGYRWGAGLGYYQSTKDLATHFFMDHLNKGTYVLDYGLRVSHKGRFESGIATLQCMYAPEFLSHSNSTELDING